MTSRRAFLTTATASAAGLLMNQVEKDKDMKNIFVHHVYFWLKNPESKSDLARLKEGLEKLSKVKAIRQFHIGKPADTNREVIDRSYAISWLALFDNKADQDSYQADPIHLDFVRECSHLWSKVTVYDSVDA